MVRVTWVKIAGLLVVPGLLAGMGVRVSLSQAPAMHEARAGHSATRLPDGTVLIAGGCVVDGCDGGLTASAERYEPVQHAFADAPSLAVARVGHQAVSLMNGDVLILGGWAGEDVTAVAERYDPETDTFAVVGEMVEARDGFTATPLRDGRVLIVGGYSGSMNRLNSAELYDPVSNSFTALPAMHEARMSHSATRLPDGSVLIVGGSSASGTVSTTAELFDPLTEGFSLIGPLTMPRHKHAAVLLQNGNVLIIGGAGPGDWDEQYNTTELFDTASEAFRPAASMTSRRFKLPDAVTLLPDGSVLVAGGGAQAERYNPDTDSFSPVTGDLGFDLAYTTATPLLNEEILIAGGYDEGLRVVDNAWIYAGR